MGKILPFPEDRHHETQLLLPWYVNGRLEGHDRELVEAHLQQCAECRADLSGERDLRSHLVELTPDDEHRWDTLHARLEPPSRTSGRRTERRRWAIVRAWAAEPRTLRRIVGVQAAALLALAALAFPSPQQARYRVLGDPPAANAGNAIIIFRPDVREAAMRGLLEANGVQLVGGPTAADAYVLAVPAAGRMDRLASLRRNPAVVLAEPIDRAQTP